MIIQALQCAEHSTQDGLCCIGFNYVEGQRHLTHVGGLRISLAIKTDQLVSDCLAVTGASLDYSFDRYVKSV